MKKEYLGDFDEGSIQYKYLEIALKDFLEIKKKYIELNINPCFIIQISNKDEGDTQFEIIKRLLNSPAFSDFSFPLF